LELYNNAAHPVISEDWHFSTMLLTQLQVRVGTLQQCCSLSYKQGLALYNNAAYRVIREDWHFKTMLLTQL
jgi:hypothetical protein